jgi:hypothetical protein
MRDIFDIKTQVDLAMTTDIEEVCLRVRGLLRDRAVLAGELRLRWEVDVEEDFKKLNRDIKIILGI